MAILIPRIRTIGVRLSQYEYSVLQKFCVETGARSMSDVARDAIANFIRDVNWKNTLAAGANLSSTQLRDLEEKVEQLMAEIALLKVAGSPRDGNRNQAQKQTEIA